VTPFFAVIVIQGLFTSVPPPLHYIRALADESAKLQMGKDASMTYLVAYVAALVVFGIIDAAWLNSMGKILYRPTLGDILLTDLRIAPAIIFYLAYPIGVVVFAVMPGLRANSILVAFLSALLFGAIAYGTYDLTNYATLRNWTLQITLIDICYGALVSGIAAAAATLLVRTFTQ
jgi:uncharacterized membrane protein